MKYLEALYYIILTVITVVFFFPSFLVSAYVSFIIPPILSFCLLSYLALKNKSIKGEIINILLHLCMIGCYIFEENSSADYSYLGLSVKNTVISCVFTMFVLIFFIAYILVVAIKESKNSLQKHQQPIKTVKQNTKFCIHCGAYNDESNEKCTNCGMRLN